MRLFFENVGSSIGAGVTVVQWVAAWNAALDCNQIVLPLKQEL